MLGDSIYGDREDGRDEIFPAVLFCLVVLFFSTMFFSTLQDGVRGGSQHALYVHGRRLLCRPSDKLSLNK